MAKSCSKLFQFFRGNNGLNQIPILWYKGIRTGHLGLIPVSVLYQLNDWIIHHSFQWKRKKINSSRLYKREFVHLYNLYLGVAQTSDLTEIIRRLSHSFWLFSALRAPGLHLIGSATSPGWGYLFSQSTIISPGIYSDYSNLGHKSNPWTRLLVSLVLSRFPFLEPG